MISDVTLTPESVAVELRPVLLRLARELRKETEQLGITARQTTLLWLVKRSPGLSLAELAAEEGISPPAMSGHVDRLERAGLLARERSSDDRRRVGLRLTDEGRTAAAPRPRPPHHLAGRSPAHARPPGARRGRGCRPGTHATRRARRVTTLAFALRARTFRSLRRHRNYRIFFSGQLVSLAGTWMQNVALAWLVIELSGSAHRDRRARVLALRAVHALRPRRRRRRGSHRVAQARHDDTGRGDGDLDRARRGHVDRDGDAADRLHPCRPRRRRARFRRARAGSR